MIDILKIWRHIHKSVDAYLLEEQSRQISPWSNLNRQSIRFFEKSHPENDKMSSNMQGSPSFVIQRFNDFQGTLPR